MDCISPDALAEYLQGGLSGAGRAEVEGHVDGCPACRALIAALAEADLVVGDDPEPGRWIGRYRVDDELGSGAMGIVYAAHDPELRRELAIKVLHPDRIVPGGAPRMLREAEAMAAVTHRNVIAVFDVGTTGDGVFIAMERIDGVTLRQWLAAEPRSSKEIAQAFAQAGRGLHAAHSAGLVHRDFKPDNVLVERGGRVVVTDFGLARVDMQPTDSSRERPSAKELSVTGALVGTPAYMAPEQLTGGRGDASSDQFAFCVALHEALTGARPFDGNTTTQLRAAIERGVRRTGERKIGKRFARVLARGLRADPDERFGNMGELVAELERTPRSWRPVITGVALVALAGGVIASSMLRDACTQESVAWSTAEREAIGRALSSGGDYGAEASERVSERLEDFAQAWGETAATVCQAGADANDPRRRCITAQRERFDALVEVLKRPGEDRGSEAITAAVQLPDPSDCLENAPSGPRLADPTISPRLAQAHALLHAGRLDAGLDEARATRAAALEAGDPIGEAEAAILVGRALSMRGDMAAAEKELNVGYALATANGDDRSAGEAASELAFVVGVELMRTDEGLTWARHAQAALARGDGDLLIGASIHKHIGDLHSVLGNEELALPEFEQAAADLEAAGADDLLIGSSHCVMGASLKKLGRFDEARAGFDAAIATLESAAGDGHPRLTACQLALGNLLASRGKLAAAEEVLKRALAGTRRARGADHPVVARYLSGIAALRMHQLRSEEAAELYREILAIDEREKGQEHPDVAADLANLGVALDAAGHPEEARASAERALVITTATLGPDHPRVGRQLMVLGTFSRRAGDMDEARSLLERAIEALTASNGADHPIVAAAREELGVVLIESDPEAAVVVLQRALDDFAARLGPNDRNLSNTHARMSEALMALGRRGEARKHLQRASDIITPLLGNDHPSVEELRARLAAMD